MTNEQTKTVVPFAIDCTELTFEQVVEIVQKSVEAGAEHYEAVAGSEYDGGDVTDVLDYDCVP